MLNKAPSLETNWSYYVVANGNPDQMVVDFMNWLHEEANIASQLFSRVT